MPRKPKLKTCIQCNETKEERKSFYKQGRFRTSARCKSCISANNKAKRDASKILNPNKKCKGCGEMKSVSEYEHGLSLYCKSCKNDIKYSLGYTSHVTEDKCIICGEVKPRDQFRRIYRKGSKCIECVDAKTKKQKKEYNKKYFRKISSIVKDFGKCKDCGETKDRDHFTVVKNYGGLSKVCNECKSLHVEMNKKNKVLREKERLLKKRLCERDRFEERLNSILIKYPNSRIMSEIEFAGCVLCSDLSIRRIENDKYVKRISRSTEELYFKYFAPDVSMEEYYYDFRTKELVKWNTDPNRIRNSKMINRPQKIEYDRRSRDPIFRLRMSITCSFWNWMKGKKEKSTWKYLDYTLGDLKEHLESQFVEGMSWDNYGWDGWWVDHIVPRDSFDMNDPEQIRECWKLSNLQPLWKEDNMRKGNSIVT